MALPCLAQFLWISNFLINTFLISISLAFQLIVVLPEIYENDAFCYLNWTIGTFICFNIIANLLACNIVDTSINCITDRPPKDSIRHASWHFCRKCDTLVPPRAWHCEICEICILKRDHHCSFSGCCIGHRNSRYFLMFIVYVFIGTTFATIHNSIYFWCLQWETYGNWYTIVKLIFPVLFFWPINWKNAYLFTYAMNFTLAGITCGIMVMYLKCFMTGSTLYEFRSKEITFDLGSKKRNLEMVLGKRMYLVWLSPFVKSNLPHDGINWVPSTEQSP